MISTNHQNAPNQSTVWIGGTNCVLSFYHHVNFGTGSSFFVVKLQFWTFCLRNKVSCVYHLILLLKKCMRYQLEKSGLSICSLIWCTPNKGCKNCCYFTGSQKVFFRIDVDQEYRSNCQLERLDILDSSSWWESTSDL